jgi:hypothetical protein
MAGAVTESLGAVPSRGNTSREGPVPPSRSPREGDRLKPGECPRSLPLMKVLTRRKGHWPGPRASR